MSKCLNQLDVSIQEELQTGEKKIDILNSRSPA